MRISSAEANEEVDSEDSEDSISNVKAAEGMPELIQGTDSEALPLSEQCPISDEDEPLLPLTKSEGAVKVLSFFCFSRNNIRTSNAALTVSQFLNTNQVFLNQCSLSSP